MKTAAGGRCVSHSTHRICKFNLASCNNGGTLELPHNVLMQIIGFWTSFQREEMLHRTISRSTVLPLIWWGRLDKNPPKLKKNQKRVVVVEWFVDSRQVIDRWSSNNVHHPWNDIHEIDGCLWSIGWMILKGGKSRCRHYYIYSVDCCEKFSGRRAYRLWAQSNTRSTQHVLYITYYY